MGNKLSSNYSSESMNDEDSDEASYYTAESTEEGVEQLQRTNDHNLLYAVQRCDVAGVQQALRQGANANVVCSAVETPLMKACERGFDKIVRILLEAGADPWWRNLQKQSAIEEAVEQGHLSIVELLINHDKGLLEIKGSFEQTPLLRAINRKHFEIVYFLLDRGANALAADECGMTTLILACE